MRARILSIGQFFLILIKISHIKWTNRNGLEFTLSCKSDSTWVVSRYYATIASHTRNFYNKHRIFSQRSLRRRFQKRITHGFRTNRQKPRQLPAHRHGVHERTGLRRANLVDPLPQVPRRSREDPADRCRAAGQTLYTHYRHRVPMERLGNSTRCTGKLRHIQRAGGRRPHRVRQQQALPLSAEIQGDGSPEIHRNQDRRHLLRDPQPHPERLQPPRRTGAGG